MNEEQLEKLKKLDEFLKKSEVSNNLPLFEVLQDINKTLKIIAEKEMPEMPKMEMPDTHRVEIAGAELVTIKGDKGEQGEMGPQGESIVGPVGPKGMKGEKGDDGAIGPKGDDGISPSVAEISKATSEILTPLLPKKDEIISEILEKGDKIIKAINSDESENLIKREKVEGLNEELTAIRNLPRGAMGVRRIFQPKRDDFSALTDGSTKIFYLSKAPIEDNIIMVFGTDFPTILRPTIDFTIANKTLTLTDAVPAPNAGATLIVTYFT